MNTWVLKGTAMPIVMDFTLSPHQKSVPHGRFLGTPPLLRSSKSYVLFLPLLLLIQAIDI